MELLAWERMICTSANIADAGGNLRGCATVPSSTAFQKHRHPCVLDLSPSLESPRVLVGFFGQAIGRFLVFDLIGSDKGLECPPSQSNELVFERGKARQRMSSSEAIDMVERGGHCARHRCVILPAQERVEPNQPAGAALQTLELDGQRFGWIGVVAVAHHDHDAAGI